MFNRKSKDMGAVRGRVPLKKKRESKNTNPNDNTEEPQESSVNINPKKVFNDLGLDEINLPVYKFACMNSESKNIVDSFLVHALDYATDTDDVIPFFTGTVNIMSYTEYIKLSEKSFNPRDMTISDDGVINLSRRNG